VAVAIKFLIGSGRFWSVVENVTAWCATHAAIAAAQVKVTDHGYNLSASLCC
jgi:hypothetical protein